MAKINGRRKGGGRSLYVSFNSYYFYAIIFYAVVLFSFLCCFIDEGAVKLGEEMNVVAPVRRGFLLFFIFYYFYFIGHFIVYACYLCGSVEQREHFFLGTIMQAEVVQEMCQGPKEAVVIEDGVSISITGRHHHRSTTDKKEGHADTKRHTQQANKQDYRNDTDSAQQTNGPHRQTPR